MDKQDVSQPRVLVLGIGNLVMSDDGVGVLVVQRLQRDYRLPGHVEVMDGGTLGLDILPRLEGIERLLIIDAVETGLAPGSCVRMAGDEIPVALETKVSPHQMGLKDLLAVAMLLGHVPQEMVLVGVQPGSIEMGIILTPAVEAQLDHLLKLVLSELNGWGVHLELA
ncbi:MAG TPA: HyaD/HybD family hydrogenase maturation endopeptidase [Desulfuromonadaceae bacterium]|jgi:hydrogenase maturation protease